MRQRPSQIISRSIALVSSAAVAALATASVAVGGAACGGVSFLGSDAGYEASVFDAVGVTSADTAACTEAALATCALMARCSPHNLAENYGVEDTCITRQTISCEISLLAPGTGKTLAETTMCAVAEGAESCTDDLNLAPPGACRQQVGHGGTGSACGHSAQCASGFCAIEPQNDCGTCQLAPTVGASCASLTSCGQGLDCMTDTCVAYVTEMGEACSPTAPCGAGLACVMQGSATSGVCESEAETVGATCDPTGAGCDRNVNLWCVNDPTLPDFGTCQPVAYAMPGSPCYVVNGVQTYCALGTCVPNGDGSGATCVGRAGDGEPCNSVSGPACISPSRCVGTEVDGGTSGLCQLPAEACP
jgi:hypothetical protein